jgi:hypothetical protein
MPAATPVFHILPDLESGHAFSGQGVRAGVRPVRSLGNGKRWFDELRYTAHAFEPTVDQWARIQASALGSSFRLLEAETVRHVGLQLSLSAVQRELETLVGLVADNCLLCHRLTVMLCGAPVTAVSAHRIRAFIEFLRGYYVTVGFRVFSQHLTMEMPAIDLLTSQGWGFKNLYAETFGELGSEGRESESQIILTRFLTAAPLQSIQGGASTQFSMLPLNLGTQADVTEFARALTGWSVRQPHLPGRLYAGAIDGSHGFAFVPLIHEPGTRQIMGRSYPQGGGDQALAILSDLAAHPATGRKVARQLAVHFHSDTPPASLVERLEQAWTRDGGRLDSLALALIDAPEMWAAAPGKFKRPEEFILSAYRALGLAPQRIAALQPALVALGQPPWAPPSPEGWPDETAAWAAPDAVIKRLTWAQRFSELAVRDQSPVDLADAALGPRLTDQTRTAVRRAEDRAEAVAILLMSPEFQRR